MGEFHRRLNVNPMAMSTIGQSYQAGVCDIPPSIQQKEIAIADRKFEMFCVGLEGVHQILYQFRFPISTVQISDYCEGAYFSFECLSGMSELNHTFTYILIQQKRAINEIVRSKDPFFFTILGS